MYLFQTLFALEWKLLACHHAVVLSSLQSNAMTYCSADGFVLVPDGRARCEMQYAVGLMFELLLSTREHVERGAIPQR